jgi:hypothetical protein
VTDRAPAPKLGISIPRPLSSILVKLTSLDTSSLPREMNEPPDLDVLNSTVYSGALYLPPLHPIHMQHQHVSVPTLST